MTGSIYRIVRDKGFVFIRDDEGRSRFAHARSFDPPSSFDTVTEGARVMFTPTTDGPPEKGDGLRANEVRILS